MDDVTGLLFHVPGEGQPFNMSENFVAHRTDKQLSPQRIEQLETVLEEQRKDCGDNNRRRNQPQMPAQVGHTADLIEKRRRNPRQANRLAAQHRVNGKPNNLRAEHIGQRHTDSAEKAKRKIPFAALQKM